MRPSANFRDCARRHEQSFQLSPCMRENFDDRPINRDAPHRSHVKQGEPRFYEAIDHCRSDTSPPLMNERRNGSGGPGSAAIERLCGFRIRSGVDRRGIPDEPCGIDRPGSPRAGPAPGRRGSTGSCRARPTGGARPPRGRGTPARRGHAARNRARTRHRSRMRPGRRPPRSGGRRRGLWNCGIALVSPRPLAMVGAQVKERSTPVSPPPTLPNSVTWSARSSSSRNRPPRSSMSEYSQGSPARGASIRTQGRRRRSRSSLAPCSIA